MPIVSEQEATQRVAELWRATFGEQPSVTADASLMLGVLVTCLPDPGPWTLGRPIDRPSAGKVRSGDLERLEDG